jgi:hypothetical protein
MKTFLSSFLSVHSRCAKQQHAIVIGVSRYRFGYASLDFAGADALQISNVLGSLNFEVQSLATQFVNKQAVLDALDALLPNTGDPTLGAKPGDKLVFYFSGHGSRRLVAGQEEDYLLFSDTNPDNFTATALSLSELKAKLEQCLATERIFIIDACRDAAKSGGTSGFADGRLQSGFKDRMDAVVRVGPRNLSIRGAVLYACLPGQRAKESGSRAAAPFKGAGVFTLGLLKVLKDNEAGCELRQLLPRIAAAIPPDIRGKERHQQFPDLAGDTSLVLAPKQRSTTTAPPPKAAPASRPTISPSKPSTGPSKARKVSRQPIVPPTTSVRKKPSAEPDPKIEVLICSDSNLRANEYCFEVIRLMLPKSRVPKRICLVHGAKPDSVRKMPSAEPDPKIEVLICSDSNLRANEYCVEVIRQMMLKSKAPKRICLLHGTQTDERSI